MDVGNSASVPLPEGEVRAVGEPERKAERQLPEASVGDGQEFQVDGGDGLAKVEGDGREGDLPSVLLKKKKNDSLIKVPLAAALVLMLAVTGWLLYKKVLAPPPKPPLPPVTEIDEQIELYSRKMIDAREGLDEAWSKASNTVRRAFTTNYMPSTDREHVPESQALSYYKMHVLEMLELPRPAAHDDVQQKKEYLYKLQMLTSILEAAALRLDALKTLEARRDFPALILGRESGELEYRSSGIHIDFKTFVHNLGERRLRYTPLVDPPQSKQTVPGGKALDFLDLLTAEDRMATADREVHQAFEHFLAGQGLSLKTLQAKDAAKVASIKLPRDPTAMNTRMFVQFLHSRHRSAGAEEYRRDTLDFLAANWNEEAVDKAMKRFKEHHRGEIKDLVRQKREMLSQAREKEPVPLSHGYPVALFLL